jgi:hypothetical protein
MKNTNGSNPVYLAFRGTRLLWRGELPAVLEAARTQTDPVHVLIFEERSGAQIDFDLRGSREEVLARLATHKAFASQEAPAAAPRGPGRPKLGVSCREICLLPDQWE